MTIGPSVESSIPSVVNVQIRESQQGANISLHTSNYTRKLPPSPDVSSTFVELLCVVDIFLKIYVNFINFDLWHLMNVLLAF